MVDAPQTRQETKAVEETSRRPQPPKWVIAVIALIGGLLVATLILLVVQPGLAQAQGDASKSTRQLVDDQPKDAPEGTGVGLSEEIAATLTPDSVSLGATGGEAELKRCDGTFTHLTAYGAGLATPVWAAHNNCGGDVVLSWVIGQQVTVTTGDTSATYVVVDARETSKTKGKTEDLIGMTGLLLLQTCYYGEDRMRFVGLDPAPA